MSFGCLFPATSDNVKTTLSQRCVSDVVAPTKIRHCYNVAFSTSIFRSDTNVVATLCFWDRFSNENLTTYQCHYDSFLPKFVICLLMPVFDKQNWSCMRQCKAFTRFAVHLKIYGSLIGQRKEIFDLVSSTDNQTYYYHSLSNLVRS